MFSFNHSAIDLAIIFILSISSPLFSQTAPGVVNHEKLFLYTSIKYGPDAILFQGDKYTNLNPLAENHPYWNSIQWTPTTIYAANRVYKEVSTRYDIEQNILITQMMSEKGTLVFIQLPSSVIDSFAIGKSRFLNTKYITRDIAENNFRELIYRGNTTYLLRHSKVFIKNYNSLHPHGLYSKQNSVLQVVKNNKVTNLPGRRSLLKFYPNSKKEIRNFLRKNHIRYKKIDRKELESLCIFLETLTAEE